MEPKLIEHLLCQPKDNGILWIELNQPERMNDLVGTAEENGTVAEIGDMRAGDDDSDIRIVALTLVRLLSAHPRRAAPRGPRRGVLQHHCERSRPPLEPAAHTPF
jgi:hypothetical protein